MTSWKNTCDVCLKVNISSSFKALEMNTSTEARVKNVGCQLMKKRMREKNGEKTFSLAGGVEKAGQWLVHQWS